MRILGKEWAYEWHDVFAEVSICVSPCGAVLNHVVGAGGAELGYHQWCSGCWDDDCAL
jgi:hypothetical protein